MMESHRLPSLPSAGAVLKKWRSGSTSSVPHSIQSAQDGDSTASLLGSTMLHLSRVDAWSSDRASGSHAAASSAHTVPAGKEHESARDTLAAVQRELYACQQLCSTLRNEASQSREEAHAALVARDAAQARAALAESRLLPLQESVDRLTAEHVRSADRVAAAAGYELSALAELTQAKDRLSSLDAELHAWRAEGARVCTMAAWHTARLMGRPEPARNAATPTPADLHASLSDLVSAVSHMEEKAGEEARQWKHAQQASSREAQAEIKRLRALLQAALGTDERSYAVQSLGRSLAALESSPSSTSSALQPYHGSAYALQQLPSALLEYSGLLVHAQDAALEPPEDSSELNVLRKHVIACEVRICELRAALTRAQAQQADARGGRTEAATGMPDSIRLALSAGAEEVCLNAGQVALWQASIRSGERESMLAELQGAQGGEGRVDTLAMAQARAASAERHCTLLQSALSACERAWSVEQSRLVSLQRGAVEAEATWRDKERTGEEAVRQAQEEVARLQGLLASSQTQHQSDMEAVSSDVQVLESMLSQLQGEVVAAHAKVRELEAQVQEERKAHAAELQSSVNDTRSSVEHAMLRVMEERVGAAVSATREECAAVAKEDKALALTALEARLREQHGQEMEQALEQASSLASQRLAEAISSTRAQVESSMQGYLQAELREKEQALEQKAAEQAAVTEERIHNIMTLCEEQARAAQSEAETSISSAYADCDMRLAEGRREVEAAQAQAQAEVEAERAAADRYRTLAKNELLRRRMLQSKLMDLQGHVRVMVRVRPTQAQIQRMREGVTGMQARAGAVAPRALQDITAELLGEVNHGSAEGDSPSTLRLVQEGQVTLSLPHGGAYYYEYDDCYGPYAGQEAVFDAVRPMLDHALSTGGNTCILAYGQTGSGKTYTIEGMGGRAGIVPRALQLLFFRAKAKQQAQLTSSPPSLSPLVPPMTFTLSVLEVYRDRVRDLLAQGREGQGESFQGGMGVELRAWVRDTERIGAVGGPSKAWASALRVGDSVGEGGVDHDNLLLRETEEGVEVVGAVAYPIHDEEEALHAIRLASSARHTGSHDLNEHSSRSHMIVKVHVTVREEGRMTTSVLQFVDLAGSERLSRSHSSGEMAKDAASINSSLSSLGGVLTARRKAHSHVPYRDSKLTFALKDCLTGKARVLLLACVSGEQRDVAETASTLTFAASCRATPLALPPPTSPSKGKGGGSPRPGNGVVGAGEQTSGPSAQPIYDSHPFYSDPSQSPPAVVTPPSLMSPSAGHGAKGGKRRAGSVG